MSTHSFSRLLCAILLVALPCAALAQTSSEEFTIIALPDTQNYSKYYPEIFHAQTQWIVDQREARNIRLVVGLGDIVHGGGELIQWQNASAAYSRLDGVVPYVLPLGNHDYDRNDPANRTASTKNFNSYFGPSRYQNYSWYAGQWPAGSNENFYARVSIHGVHYLVMALEYAPREKALEWASSVVSGHPGHQVIVVTHSYMQVDDRRLVPGCYKYSAPYYDMTDYNEGDALWNKFLSRHKNIFLVLSGHSTARDGAGRRADLGVHGNLVNQILSNYQHYSQGGGGYLRIVRVRPALNRIEVSTYSPYLDQWLTDPRHQFSVSLREAAPTSSAGSLDGFVRHDCQPVAGATVATKAGTVQTNTEGYYKLDLPAPDVYAVKAEKSAAGSGSGSTVVQPAYTSALDLFLGCAKSATDPSVTICAPGDGATVISPVRIMAGVTSSTSVDLMQVYIDGQKAYEALVSELDVSLDIAEGTRRLTVQARNSAGQWFNQSIHIQVADPSSPGACAASEDQSVKICTPTHGERVTSPARIVAGATSSHGVNLMQVYLDGKKVHEVAAAGVDTTLSMAEGERRIAVQARDNSGAWFKSVINVHVESGACVLSATDPSVTICAPASGSTVASPVRIVAGTTSSREVNLIQLYVDGAKVWEDYASQMDGSFALAAGTRRVTVQARDSAGNWFKSSVNITVE